MVNNYVAVYDKSGNLQSGFPKAADTFFGLASGTTPQTLAPSTIGLGPLLCVGTHRDQHGNAVAAQRWGRSLGGQQDQ